MSINNLLSKYSKLFRSEVDEALFDRQLVWISLGLMMIGFIMVTSASFPVSFKYTNQLFYFVIRHGAFLFLSLFMVALVVNIPLSQWFRYRKVLFSISVLLLIVVFFVGKSVNGASRWISLGILNFQPAELAKLAVFISLAGYLAKNNELQKKDWRSSVRDEIIKPMVILFFPALLLLSQPDLGTIVVITTTVFAMLFIARIKKRYFVLLLLLSALVFMYLIWGVEYRQNRITAFLAPWDDPFNTGYQLTQSLMAFGRGGFWGQGLGNSILKLEYLPEAHTDFVFSILAEELGFLGVLCTLILLFSLIFKAIFISKRALSLNQYFGGYLATGIGVWFVLQTLVNIGAAAGIVPTKGLTLPLISYGGSSLLIIAISVAILLRIDHESRLSIRKNIEHEKE